MTFNCPLPLAGEGVGEGGTLGVSPSPQSSPPVRGEEIFGVIFYIMPHARRAPSNYENGSRLG